MLTPSLLALLACGGPPEPKVQTPEAPAAEPVAPRHVGLFQPLPDVKEPPDEPSRAKIGLGKALYFDERLSPKQDLSCNSCHDLARYGVDGAPTAPGHGGQRRPRNSPSTYNAFLHVAQSWDGRAPDVEAQARGPVTHPRERSRRAEAALDAVLRSIPGYAGLFAAAFPAQKQPVSFANAAVAIGAFERTLVTPAPFDRYLKGDTSALAPQQLAGLDLFVSTGCGSCHMGPGVGGGMVQKLGLVKPYATPDEGRFSVTKNEADRFFFKVPSLRNVTKTAPYFHDGSVATLEEAVGKMAEHQLGKTLTPAEVSSIVSFLGALTGHLPGIATEAPELPG
jgi:cytochrome c peroxidase